MSELLMWEYRTETLGAALSGPKDQELEDLLNQWGCEGWEVISAFALSGSNKIKVIAKRPLSERSRRQREWPNY